MYNGPEDNFAFHGDEPTGTIHLPPRIKQITNSVGEGVVDYGATLWGGGNRLSRRLGFHGNEARELVIAEHARFKQLFVRVCKNPQNEYRQLKGIIYNYYETQDKEQNIINVTDEFASHQIPKMIGTGIAGITTIGVLSAWPTSFILNRYFGQFEDTIYGRMKKFAVKTGIKKLAVVPIVTAPLVPIEIAGAIENSLKDSQVIKANHPELYVGLRRYDYDLLASFYLPLIEAVDRERKKRSGTKSIKIEEV